MTSGPGSLYLWKHPLTGVFSTPAPGCALRVEQMRTDPQMERHNLCLHCAYTLPSCTEPLCQPSLHGGWDISCERGCLATCSCALWSLTILASRSTSAASAASARWSQRSSRPSLCRDQREGGHAVGRQTACLVQIWVKYLRWEGSRGKKKRPPYVLESQR